MRNALIALLALGAVAAGARPDEPRRGALGPKIENPTNQFLVWGDYRIEVNQYNGLGRDWPWQFRDEQYAILKKKAQANPAAPNVIRAILLVCPVVEATAIREENGKRTVVGIRTSRMTPLEIRSSIEQWHTVEDLVYVFSGGNAVMLTDVKIIPEPLKVETDENWGHFSGPKYALLERYLPFERGDYDSYNSIYSNRGLNGGPWGGTLGAVAGVKGCPTSDNLWLAEKELETEHAWVFWHEFLNQCCSSTSHIMPYQPDEQLWNMYCWEWTGHRSDPVPHWPGWTNHRDMMRMVIRPKMWQRWRVTTPYKSPVIGRWLVFGPLPKSAHETLLPPAEPDQPAGDRFEADGDVVRQLCIAADADGRRLDVKVAPRENVDLGAAFGDPKSAGKGTYYLRTYVKTPQEQDVHILAGGDEDFELWLNGNKIRDGYGWKYSEDDGQMFEKVTYARLKAGTNTLMYVIPNTDERVETRLRFGRPDGSGEHPDGVTCAAGLGRNEQPLPLDELTVWDFRNPRLFKWADVADDPWLSMPRLDEAALRALTGIPTLKIRTDGKVRPHKDERGQPDFQYVPCQHIFLDVPREAVTSPWIAEPAEDTAQLNNDFDFNWKAAAWLRIPGRAGPEKDVLLLRNDVAEPLLHLLKTKGRAGQESLVGWVLVERKLAYVALVDLELERVPTTELDLLRKAPETITPVTPQ